MLKLQKMIEQKTIGNRILRALPAEEWSRLAVHLEPAEWPLGTLIHEAGEAVDFVAFPNSGLLSAILKSEQNVNVEIGLAGAEGLDGVNAILADVPSVPRVTVQVAGDGLHLPAAVLRDEWRRGAALQHFLIGYNDVAATQSARQGLCNRLHTTEERLSGWLLTIQDRVGGDSFALAPAFIAAMLGGRVSGVPVALGILQQAGVIQRTVETIEILDREQLKASACECYPILSDRFKLWEQTLSATSYECV